MEKGKKKTYHAQRHNTHTDGKISGLFPARELARCLVEPALNSEDHGGPADHLVACKHLRAVSTLAPVCRDGEWCGEVLTAAMGSEEEMVAGRMVSCWILGGG